VLDPFVGVGTTCLACRELGIDSVGVDISPLFALIARVKTRDHDPGELSRTRDEMFSVRFEKPDITGISPFTRRLFSRYVLEDIVFFRERIMEIEDDASREFFLLALMNASVKTSYIYRDGAVVKVRKKAHHPPSLRKMFRRVVNRMLGDLKKAEIKPSRASIYVGDARQLDFLEDSSFDAVITSPPYLNKIEYTRVYEPEYELFLPGAKVDAIRSYLGLAPKTEGYEVYQDLALPPVAISYFQDLRRALTETRRLLKVDGKVAMVVGGGVFPDRVIDVDLPLAQIAEEVGFEVKRIVAVNRRVATTRRVIKIGESRESLLIAEKR